MKHGVELQKITGKAAAAFMFTMALGVAGIPGNVCTTPSTTCWTPMTLDIQSFGVLHTGVDV